MSARDLQQIVSPKFDEEVLLEILRTKSGLQNVTITKIVLGEEGKKGDSYLSDLLRFSLTGCGKDQSGKEVEIVVAVIVKFLLKNIARRKTFRVVDFFQNEYLFYKNVWSSFQKFQDSKNLPKEKKFDNIPVMLAAHCDGENDFIAMEDLSFDGFQGASRNTKLDYNKTVDILKLFAEFHGLGVAFRHQNLEEFEKAADTLVETYFHERHRDWYVGFMGKIIEITKDAIAKELDKSYLEKFENSLKSEDLYQKLCDSCRVRSKFSAITHGDAWLPNFLIKPPSLEHPEKFVIIDFQLTRYTTLANDVVFFLFACIDPELLENHYDDFINEYYQHLSKTVQKYETDLDEVFTLAEFKEELAKSVSFSIGMCMEAITMSLLDDDEVSDLDAMTGDKAVPIESVWIVHPFKEQKKRQRLAALVKFVVDKKYI